MNDFDDVSVPDMPPMAETEGCRLSLDVKKVYLRFPRHAVQLTSDNILSVMAWIRKLHDNDSVYKDGKLTVEACDDGICLKGCFGFWRIVEYGDWLIYDGTDFEMLRADAFNIFFRTEDEKEPDNE
jgi:hypothetical protein